MDLLDKDAIARELNTATGWELAEDAIVRTLTFEDFARAIEYVNRVAAIAEAAGHHPDITIRWNKVTLTLSTHSAGGLTAADFQVARSLNEL